MPGPPRIFLVHHPEDVPLAERLAQALREDHGIDAWLSNWEILGGDNVVAMIEEGLRRADGGLVLVGRHGLGGWSGEQYAALIARAQENGSSVFLLPLICDGAAELPPLLKSRAPHRVEDLVAIVRSIRGHMGLPTGDKPALGAPMMTPPPPVDIELRLRREGDVVVVACEVGEARLVLPGAEAEGLGRRLIPHGPTRDSASARALGGALEAVGARLGEAFVGIAGWLAARLCDPDRGEALVRLCGDDVALLSLPWEAAQVPGCGPLGLVVRTSVLREVAPEHPREPLAIPGPLRLLIAVAAPQDDLDSARELGVILSAVEGARLGATRVVFIDEGEATLEGLRRQLDGEEPFHIVHIAAHGRPGALLLEDSEGQPESTSPQKLAETLVGARHAPALVLLSACSSGATQEGLGHMHIAHVLLRAGVPQVIAMQGPVGDGYATELARQFYGALARSPAPTAVHALAAARRAVELERKEKAARAESFHAAVPEYGTPAFYGAPGLGDRPLYDGTRPWAPIAEVGRLVQVPGLAARPIGWVVGRRRLRREVREALIREDRHGALLWGLGGAGKSSLAASALDRLVRKGWAVIAMVGVFSLADIASAAATQLSQQGATERMSGPGLRHFTALTQPAADERAQLIALEGLLDCERVVLLLDNFEDNLELDTDGLPRSFTEEGSHTSMARISDGLRRVLPDLAAAARCGALLVTCRYRVVELNGLLTPVDVGPLRATAVRQLAWRLEGLRDLGEAERRKVLEVLGGHPRVLEFADALLRTQPGHWRAAFEDVRARLEDLSESAGELLPSAYNLLPEERLELARRLAAEDALLDALVATLDDEVRRFLVAAAVFRRGVPLDAYETVATATGLSFDKLRLQKVVQLLVGRTLMSLTEDLEGGIGWVVHRWTAAELHQKWAPTAEIHVAAAKWWEARPRRSWEEGIESVEHWLAARDDESATMLGECLRRAAAQAGQNLAALALCERIVRGVSASSYWNAVWLGTAGDHLHLLGDTNGALKDVTEAVEIFQRLAAAEPGNSNLQRTLSVSYIKLGDLHVALGKGELARRFVEDALSITKSLAEAEPDRSDFQRDLYVFYIKLGDLHVAIGEGELARRYFEDALAIAQRLADAEPDRTDLQRDLFVSYNKLGEQSTGKVARRYFEDALAIAQRLAEAEPGRSDFQRDLSISYNKLGELHRSLGNSSLAHQFFEDALALRKRLTEAEPDRSDLQRNLSVSYVNLGDLYRYMGNNKLARRFFEAALTIAQRLAEAEPGRADLQNDLAVSLERLGKLHAALGHSEFARSLFEDAHAITKRFADAELGRSDLQRDLAVSFSNLGDLHFALGNGELARRSFESCLVIAERLTAAEPGRSDLQRALAVAYERMPIVEPERAVHWLSAAVIIRRQRVAAEPENVIVGRELAVALALLGRAAGGTTEISPGPFDGES